MKILDLRKKLGLLISRMRKDKKIEQSDFAYQIGIGKITLSKIERGKTDFRISSLDVIAKGFDMDIVQLMCMAQDVPVSSSKNMEKIFDLLKDEDDETIKKVVQQTEMLLSFKNKK